MKSEPKLGKAKTLGRATTLYKKFNPSEYQASDEVISPRSRKSKSDDSASVDSAQINRDVQKHIVKKASNYIGHNVLIKDGDVQMVSAKARIEAYKRQKEIVKINHLRRIDDYVSNILSESLDVADLKRQSTIDEYGVEMEDLNSETASDK